MREKAGSPTDEPQPGPDSSQSPHLSSDEWQKTFDCIPDLIAILDTEHHIIRANRSMRQALEQNGNSIIGQHCYLHVHKQDAPPDFCPHAKLLVDGNCHSAEVYLPELQGSYSVTVTPLHDAAGNLTGSIHIAHDVTARKLAEDALSKSEALYRSILLASPDTIAITNLDGCIRIVSPSGLTMFGYERLASVLGRPILEFIAPEDRERATADIILMFQGTITGPDEYRALRLDGSTIIIEANGDFIYNAEGQPESMIFSIRDISERKRIEADLNKKNSDIEQFIYTVSHDLRSPLVTVKTFLGYLEQDISTGNSERIAKDLEFMHSAADRMEILLNELLDMSRIGRAITTHEEVSFQELATEALDASAGQIATSKVTIQMSADNPTLCGDRRRLLQIWQNLLDNALKYLGNQALPRIEIGLEQQSGETVFFVRDNGIGIAAEYHEKIFGIFEQLNRQITGVGMGLTMVKRIVEIYGGQIWVESGGNGSGACFRFTLPEAIKRN
jgi:PAS domain S-box-containing protein